MLLLFYFYFSRILKSRLYLVVEYLETLVFVLLFSKGPEYFFQHCYVPYTSINNKQHCLLCSPDARKMWAFHLNANKVTKETTETMQFTLRPQITTNPKGSFARAVCKHGVHISISNTQCFLAT